MLLSLCYYWNGSSRGMRGTFPLAQSDDPRIIRDCYHRSGSRFGGRCYEGTTNGTHRGSPKNRSAIQRDSR